MAIDDVWQLQLLQVYSGQHIQNSLTFRSKSATAVTPAIAQVLADRGKEMFRGDQVVSLAYEGWVLQQLRGGTAAYNQGSCSRDGGERLEGVFTGGVAGVQNDPGMPPQSAIVTTLKTGFSGRRRRGRHYLSGWQHAGEANGFITPGLLTTLNSKWAAFLGFYGPTGTDPNFQLGVWSGRTATGCAPAAAHPHALTQLDQPDPEAAYLNVTSVQVRPIVYSQRKRTIGVGR